MLGKAYLSVLQSMYDNFYVKHHSSIKALQEWTHIHWNWCLGVTSESKTVIMMMRLRDHKVQSRTPKWLS